MKQLIFLLVIFLTLNGCKSSKQNKNKTQNTSTAIIRANSKTKIKEDGTNNSKDENSNTEIVNTIATKADNIVAYAERFEGVRYKFGGATKSGMDCSGLVFESFRAYNVILPRISRDMAKNGDKIPLKKVEKGDLLFFKTSNRRNQINHVGLVVAIGNKDIEFIHATTSKGVIKSSINESYWTKAFAEARRIL